MSFLLDALKKSESNEPQKPIDFFAEPLKVELEPETFSSHRSGLVITLVIVIIVLVAGLSFMLGREFSMDKDANVKAGETGERVVNQTTVQLKTDSALQSGTYKPAVIDDDSRLPVTDVTELTAAKEATQPASADLFSAAFNEPNVVSKIAPAVAVKNTPPALTTSTKNSSPEDTEGKRLTHNVDQHVESEPVSNSLLLRFEKAVAETMELSDQQIYETQRADIVTPLVDMPKSVQDAVPQLIFQTHIYSSNIEERWIKVNGEVVRESENIAPNLTLVEIMPQNVVLKLGNDEFSLPALSDW